MCRRVCHAARCIISFKVEGVNTKLIFFEKLFANLLPIPVKWAIITVTT